METGEKKEAKKNDDEKTSKRMPCIHYKSRRN
jgi:hypothetical protein